jgi:hypothetical protein
MLNYRRVIPRFQLSIRSTLLLVAIIALIMSYVVRLGRLPHDPYTAALYRTSEWCSSSVDGFGAESHCDWSGSGPVRVVDKPAASSMTCLFKLAYVERPKRSDMHGCNITYLAISADGRSNSTFDIYNWAIQGSDSTIPPGEMASLQTLVSKLPPSQSWIPEGNTLLVGCLRKGVWVTRTYDTGRLPPEILKVTDKTWPTVPWMPRGVNDAPAKVAAGAQSGL